MNRRLQFCISNKYISLLVFLFILALTTLIPTDLKAQPFTHRDIAVFRVGDRVTPLSTSAIVDSVFEFDTLGNGTGVTIGMPFFGTIKITNSGTALSDGYMTLSAERDQLVMVGYDATPGTSSVVSTSSLSVPRVMFTVKPDGTITKVGSTATDYTGNNIRSGTSSGSTYFSSGTAPGLEIIGTSTSLTPNPTNTRVIQIFNGQTYFSSNASSYSGISKLGTGIPTTSGQLSTLITPTISDPFSFALSPDNTTLYVADNSLGILKYTLSGSSYVYNYAVNNLFGYTGLAVDFSGSTPIIFATTNSSSANYLVKVHDFGPSTPFFALSVAPPNTVYKGVTLSPSCYASIAVSGPSVICAGDTSSLILNGNPTALVHYKINGGPTQSITLGNNGQATIHTGSLTVTSTYKLIDITTPSCSSSPLSDSATITVSIPAAIVGGPNVCLPNSITLTDVTSGGTWASSNTSVATISSTSGILSGVVTGTSIITYKLPTGCYITKSITVLTGPTSISGISNLCVGGALTASNTITGGIWSSSNTSVSSIGTASGLVTGLGAGTANITYTLSNGCLTSRSITISPNPGPISGATSVCTGFNTTLTDAGGGLWTSSNTSIASINTSSGVLSGVTAGTCIISYAFGSGCYTTTTFTVNQNPSVISGPTLVCQGTNISLSNSVAGGIWSSSNTIVASIGTGTGVVTGLSTGTSIISYILPTGCYATSPIQVNPSPATIGGAASLCVGSTSIVSNTVTGGIWSSSNTSVATIISGSGAITGISAGTCIISYTLAGGCNATISFTVNPNPSAITGSTVLCQGSNTSLSVSPSGGMWVSSNATVAGFGSTGGNFTGLSAGTSIISYVLPTGCYSTTTVQVNAAPTPIGGPTSGCIGSISVVNNSVPGGLWSSSSTLVATIGSVVPLVTGVSAGTTIITYALSNGCYSAVVFQVNTAPSAIVGASPICTGSSGVYTNVAIGGVWSSGNTSIATIGSTSGLLTAVSAGTAIITYQLGAGCRSIKVITVNPQPSPITGPGSVCAGSTITLSSSGTGLWTSSNLPVAIIGSFSGLVTSIVAGTTIITYTLASGCTTTTTVNVLLAPSAISGSNNLCLFASTSLSGSGSGIWSSSNTGIALVGSLSGIVSGVSVGSATITYAFANGCLSTLQETVKPVPASISGASTVCAGLTTLFSTISTGGVWTSSNSFLASVGSTTGVVTGIISGAVVITYTLPSGCYKTASLIVNPIPSPISGASDVCVGASTALIGPGGGLWSSSNIGRVSIGSTSGIATGVSAGSAIISYSLPTGCITTAILNSDPLPTPILGSLQVCMNSSVTLTDATTGGSWVSQNPGQATVDNLTGIVTGITYGTVGISYILPTGCFTYSIMDVQAIPAPISGLLTVCAGTSTTLVDFGGGTWSSSATAIVNIGSTSGIASGITAGTCIITYKLFTGCYVDTQLTINPAVPPISGDTEICEGLTSTLSDIGGGSWSSSDTTIANIGLSSGVVTGILSGTSVITYQLPTGCYNTRVANIHPTPSVITGMDSICMGTNTILHDSLGGGVWSSSNRTIAGIDSTSGMVIGFTPGNVNISYTLPTGCHVVEPFTVNLSPLPISGVWNLCLGETRTLTDPTSGGTWSSSNTAVTTIDPISGSINGLTLGTSTITYQLPTGCYTTAIYRVNTSPGLIAGITQLCEGASTILTDTTGGTWSSGNISIATIDTGTGLLTGVSAGTVIITYAFGPGCYATTGVTVNPNPHTITGPNNLCVASTITLGNVISGGLWFSSNSLVATIGSTTGIVTGVAAGTVGITYQLSTGCKNNITLTVNPLPLIAPITGNTSLCLGTKSKMNDAIPGGVWSIADTNIASINDTGLLSAKLPGTDTVYYKVTNGCGTATAKVVVTTYRGADSVHINIAPATQPCSGTRYQNFGTTIPQPAGMVYTWSATNAEIWVVSANRQNCLINFNTSGVSFVKLTVNLGSSECSSTDSIGYYTGVDIVPNYNVIYYNYHFICTGNSADSYQWGYDDMTTLDSTLIDGALTQNYYNTSPDFFNRYYWVMTSLNGCPQKSYYNGPMAVTNNTMKEEEGVVLFPNPVNGILNFKIANTQMTDIVDVKMLDVLGKEVNNISFKGNVGFCNFADFKAGVYLAIISKNGERVGAKAFVKK